MIKNINENSKNKNIKYYLNINFKKVNHLIIVEFETLISELKEKIYNYFKIESNRYDLYYKDIKINSNDHRPIALLFQKENEKYPLLFLVDKKINKSLSSIKSIFSITIYSNITPNKFNQILNKFFEYKNYPNDAIIKNNIKGIYEVKFRKSLFSFEFKQFFDINYNNKLKFNHNREFLPPINKMIKIRNSLMNKRCNSITNKNVNKDFSEKFISFNYINSDEKYFYDKIIDTKNWLYKKGFINNTGKYNINNNYYFIKNYVGATPNIPPVLHKFRDISKDHWINEKGFYP